VTVAISRLEYIVAFLLESMRYGLYFDECPQFMAKTEAQASTP